MALRQRFAGDTSIDFAMSSLDVSMALAPGGSYAEAASLAREGSRILEGLLGPKSSMVSFAGLVLGDALRGLGDYPKAESLLTAGYKRFEVPKPVTRPWRAFALQSLVRLAEAEGRAEDAARYRALMNQPVGPGVSRPPH